MSVQHSTSDIKSWLEIALINEHLTDFSITDVSSSGSKDGYMSDIRFVKISGTTVDKIEKEYDLVLKCGKTSKALRENLPVKEIFDQEIYIYTKVIPAFTQFQLERKIVDVFDSIAPCYGTMNSPDAEIIVFDNLNSLGYKLYDRKKPLTLEHINLVVSEYGKLHAISAAMQDQKPEKYKELVSGFSNVFREFGNAMDMLKLFGTPIDQCYELLKAEISDNASEKLKNFKGQVHYILRELIYDRNHFTVITHGDCWNNNFMFKYQDTEIDKPVHVAMLDWQASKVGSPVLDLSYFLYACMGSEHLKYFDDILKTYHDNFSKHLRMMGSDPDKIFPHRQLLADWKVFAKFGLMTAITVVKIAVSDQDETSDFGEAIDDGKDFSDTFNYEMRNKEIFKKRILCIVEHCIEKDII